MTNLPQLHASCTVLVADDEPAWRIFVRLLLEPQGYQLVEASNGVDALRAVQEFSPQVLVLDMMMPRMGGLEVCRRLRAGGAHQPGIIVMTATDDLAQHHQGAAFGADRLLIKPFDPAKLLNAVESLAASQQPAGIGSE